MVVIIDPFARSSDPFSCRNDCRMSDNRQQVTITARLDAEDAETAISIMKCDPLDQTGQNFLR